MSVAQAIVSLLGDSARDLPCAILLGIIVLLLLRMFINSGARRIFHNGDDKS